MSETSPNFSSENQSQIPTPAPRKGASKSCLACGCGLPLIFLLSVFMYLSLGSKAPPEFADSPQSTLAPTIPSNYTGDWVAADGSKLSIRADRKAHFQSKSTMLKDGSARIEESTKVLQIEAASGSGKSWKIEQAPRNNNGTTEMKLDGKVFRRIAGFDPDGSIAADGVPSEKALRDMTQQTLLDFNRAIASQNFMRFHSTLATPFQEQAQPQQFNVAFKEFIAQKLDISSIEKVPPIFSPKPGIDSDGYLSVQGHYPTRPERVNFNLKYYREDDIWKLIRLDINTAKA